MASFTPKTQELNDQELLISGTDFDWGLFAGTYHFSWSALSSSNRELRLALVRSGEEVIFAASASISTSASASISTSASASGSTSVNTSQLLQVAASWADRDGYQTASGSALLNLRAGDKVRLLTMILVDNNFRWPGLAGAGGGGGVRAKPQQEGVRELQRIQDRVNTIIFILSHLFLRS